MAAATSNREVVERATQALARRDFAALRVVTQPDIAIEWPQSGERIRGLENMIAGIQNYPGGMPTLEDARVIGAEDRWVMTPAFTVLRVEGSGDVYTTVARLTYQNGEVWHLVGISELRNGKIAKQTQFFAAPFEAPEWRSQWVERMD